MAGLFSRLFRRGRSRALAALPPAPAVAEPAPGVAGPVPEQADETGADGEISPARLDAALQRLRAEHPPAPEG